MTTLRFISEKGNAVFHNAQTGHELINDRLIKSIGYPIFSKSICGELGTNVFTVDIGGSVKVITIQDSLPDFNNLAEIVNRAITKEYGAPEDFIMVRHDDSYSFVNNGAAFSFITFPNEATALLFAGDSSLLTIGLAASTESADFYPQPRLGAFAQTMTSSDGGELKIDLPINGKYLESILYIPRTERIVTLRKRNNMRLETYYPVLDEILRHRAPIKTTLTLDLITQNLLN